MPDVAPKIVVVGSMNVDLIAEVPALPARGETIFARRVVRRFGGKGANQALAAARQGADVRLIAAVGDDANGQVYRDYWRGQGMAIDGIWSVAGVATGTAFITVEKGGENQIVVDPGANTRLTPRMLRTQAARFEAAAAVMMQGEVPVETVAEAMKIARRHGARVIFNPAPWPADFPWGAVETDLVIVNEHEARELMGLAPERMTMRRWSARAAELKVREVVVTRGEQSTLIFGGEGATEVPTMKVKAIDTVGAGDAFVGALSVRLALGWELAEAVRAANVAGALATLKVGAQEACPTWAQVKRWL